MPKPTRGAAAFALDRRVNTPITPPHVELHLDYREGPCATCRERVARGQLADPRHPCCAALLRSLAVQ